VLRLHMALIFLIFFSLIDLSVVHGRSNAPANTCLRCHGNNAPSNSNSLAPNWAQQFSMNWNMYEFVSKESPPFATIPQPNQVSRGETHYDWPERKMIEIYYDRCINIFPSGNDFSCKFISDHDKTFFIKFPLRNLEKPKSCCLWSKDAFWAPRPDVLKNMSFQKKTLNSGKTVNWWIYDIPLPGPFGYGTVDGSAEPVAFWFPVIGAWVQQNFSDYVQSKPDPKVFELPELCGDQVKVCHVVP
jgi:hypothetical protein